MRGVGRSEEWGRRSGGRDKRRIRAVCAAENAEIRHERIAVIENVETKKSACFKRIKEKRAWLIGWLIKSDDDKKTFLLLLEIRVK